MYACPSYVTVKISFWNLDDMAWHKGAAGMDFSVLKKRCCWQNSCGHVRYQKDSEETRYKQKIQLMKISVVITSLVWDPEEAQIIPKSHKHMSFCPKRYLV